LTQAINLTIAVESDGQIWKTFSTKNTNTKLENECNQHTAYLDSIFDHFIPCCPVG
jgi:hypothetical protein